MARQTVMAAYLSPAGTTERVARTLAEEAEKKGLNAELLDLARTGKGPEKAPGVLFVCSPVYSQHALPGVMDFIAALPDGSGAFAAAAAAYGTVSSGVALHEMAEALVKRGYTLLGGIKVPALHSMPWKAEEPLGAGRPDAADLAAVAAFSRAVLEKAALPGQAGMALSGLDYASDRVKEAAPKSGIPGLKKMLPPMELNEQACTRCGLCAEGCPTRNIELSPYPRLSDRCILCFNCVRLCPEDAMGNMALAVLSPEIRKRADFFREPVETRAFL